MSIEEYNRITEKIREWVLVYAWGYVFDTASTMSGLEKYMATNGEKFAIQIANNVGVPSQKMKEWHQECRRKVYG